MSRIRRENGNAALELILIAPVLLLLLAVTVAAGRTVQLKLDVQSVARESARVASTASDPFEAEHLARQRATEVANELALTPQRLDIVVEAGSFQRGTPIRVRASYRVELMDLPGLGLIPGTIELSSEHIEMVERHGSR